MVVTLWIVDFLPSINYGLLSGEAITVGDDGLCSI